MFGWMMKKTCRQERDLQTRTDRFGVEVRERVMWDIREGVVGADTFIPKHVVIITWKNMSFAGGIDIALYKVRSNINTFHHFCLVLQTASTDSQIIPIPHGKVRIEKKQSFFKLFHEFVEKERKAERREKKLVKIKHKIERCFWWIANLMSCDFSYVPLKNPPFHRFVFHIHSCRTCSTYKAAGHFPFEFNYSSVLIEVLLFTNIASFVIWLAQKKFPVHVFFCSSSFDVNAQRRWRWRWWWQHQQRLKEFIRVCVLFFLAGRCNIYLFLELCADLKVHAKGTFI